MNKKNNYNQILLIDFVPVISGIIGKIALVSSFAFVWAQELNISYPDFIYLNVRLELITACIITLIVVYLYPDASPPGTLAPLIVLIPFMSRYGVHPFILSIMVGVFGFISVKSGIFNKIYLLSGIKTKGALALVFGISGMVMSTEVLYSFFNGVLPLIILLSSLIIIYMALFKNKKTWLIIPIAAIVSLGISYIFGLYIDFNIKDNSIIINPVYWWNDIWNIGFGFDLLTILVTIPFAFFVVILWTVDTLSIISIKDDYNENLHLDLSSTFYSVSIRNAIGGFFGGAQTGSLWRSYLIPLFMTKRPIRQSAIMLGIIGLIVALLGYPVLVLSFTPLIWSVLLFGVFLPLTVTGFKNFIKADNKSKLFISIFSLLGIIINPIITWISMVIYEKMEKKLK